VSRDDKLYGLEHEEVFRCGIGEVVERAIENAGGEGEVDWPVNVRVFRRMDVKRLASMIATDALDHVLETLDEEHADPDGDATKPTQAMKDAAAAFAKVVCDEYVPWACEPTGEVIEYTREMWDEEGGVE
jgi:hypothetical protein